MSATISPVTISFNYIADERPTEAGIRAPALGSQLGTGPVKNTSRNLPI
jgi:hypothetical protein